MAAHRYWRLTITVGGSYNYPVRISELQLRDAYGGASQAIPGNGTPSALSGANPEYAFDENSGTDWLSTSNITTGNPQWIQWDFGVGNSKDIVEMALTNGSAGIVYSAVDGGLSWSDDASTWTQLIPFSGRTSALSATTVYTHTTASATVSLPSLSVDVLGGAVAGMRLPSLTGASYAGSNSAAMLPTLRAEAHGGASAAITLPNLTATAQGHDSTGEQAANIALPSLSVSARAGSNTRLTLPSLTAQAAGTVTGSARADISLPSLSAQAGATVSGSASIAITLPSLSGTSYAGALCSVTIGKLTTQATSTTGGIGGARVMLPLFQATAIATAQNHGYANITLPSLSMGATVRAAISLPGLTLTAIGTAVVTATYEAYAVNLLHRDPNASDEATRYTNFPFTHVVRYQGSYYGANTTGLYLLEGTTDAGTAIPWEVKTAMTDFKSPMKKVPEAAYFSGRFGPNSTIRLHVGEKAPITYAFATPRGQLAQNHRQKFGKGKECQSRYYALSASGTGEADIDGIEPVFHNTTRRI